MYIVDRKSKLAKQIKKEIRKVRRQLALQKDETISDQEDNKSADTGDYEY